MKLGAGREDDLTGSLVLPLLLIDCGSVMSSLLVEDSLLFRLLVGDGAGRLTSKSIFDGGEEGSDPRGRCIGE